MITVVLVLAIVYLAVKLTMLEREMGEYRTHGLSWYCDDPSAHYKITIGQKTRKKKS